MKSMVLVIIVVLSVPVLSNAGESNMKLVNVRKVDDGRMFLYQCNTTGNGFEVEQRYNTYAKSEEIRFVVNGNTDEWITKGISPEIYRFFSRNACETSTVSLVDFVNNGHLAFNKKLGDRSNGKKLYAANCSSCHGKDGNALDINGNMNGTQGVGWLAKDNPQVSIDRYRWGHPNTNMPSMVVDAKLSDNQILDLLSYAQTLE